MLIVMSNYDSLSCFINYTDKEEWKNIENCFITLCFKDVRKQLEEVV